MIPFIAYHPAFCHPLPEGHRFPMIKYDLIPKQLIYQGVCTPNQFFKPEAMGLEMLRFTHSEDYIQSLLDGSISAKAMRKIGFPPSPALLERERVICQGTLDCARYALNSGAAMNVAGGTHHAYKGHGEGFCLFNDFAVALNVLIRQGRIKKALVLDLDVHQGNGTAALFEGREEVYTFSMH